MDWAGNEPGLPDPKINAIGENPLERLDALSLTAGVRRGEKSTILTVIGCPLLLVTAQTMTFLKRK